ncbi:hypothetical protein BpHYR1_009179 [Brachionus plicatilis]|uniref:Uncharacterized protein n=1 Tax=Brachionus plicatilis TaxID=10195 RepID=A0A3M7RMW5_BRAPC|nr:hypothetical protein BpHYR1_009179 [Brachionus plicatilis]
MRLKIPVMMNLEIFYSKCFFRLKNNLIMDYINMVIKKRQLRKIFFPKQLLDIQKIKYRFDCIVIKVQQSMLHFVAI